MSKQIQIPEGAAAYIVNYYFRDKSANITFFFIFSDKFGELKFTRCRELFCYYYDYYSAFGQSCNCGYKVLKDRFKSGIRGFRLLEKKLGLTGKDKIKFKLSSIPNLILFDVPGFWRKNTGRLSLFSLFL